MSKCIRDSLMEFLAKFNESLWGSMSTLWGSFVWGTLLLGKIIIEVNEQKALISG
ncbi:hypothetical protein DFP94_10315 [Fontibacillus phaseoli]|uniref:Uncharacterized protein n=1 Tax=Fontibacillus phaseoli TaxID=1416533 RepID=A0A369BIP0_9BACL|nr:hypothetical protein DFP94_10315 [Fontibacillus phaseoli]